MSMVVLELAPRDLLFLRDGRPLDVRRNGADTYRNIGHGAFWPRPDHFYNAVLHAVLNQSAGKNAGKIEYGKHGDLRTAGPFPMKDGKMFFPRPLDWKMSVERLGQTDLPDYLTHGFSDCDPTKKAYPAWVSEDEYAGYLIGRCAELDEKKPRELYYAELRTGNTLDKVRHVSARSQEGLLARYSAEYLRLAQGVTMWGAVDLSEKCESMPQAIVMGGQGGVVRVIKSPLSAPKKLSDVFPMPSVTGPGEVFVRWTLLTPAYFPETGWLPSFCKDSRKNVADSERQPMGRVMFPNVREAALIGACTGKPIAFSGYDSQNGIKPTVLVVPAGSAYLFKCSDYGAANALIEKLHLQPRSQNSNSGFGIGVCSLVTSCD